MFRSIGDRNMKLSLREIQLASFEILKEVKHICNKHSILYFLDAGTLLGAVRHKGFIPWDDDIDIIFWRKDYEKFLSVVRKELPSHLKLILPEENKHFFDFIGKIINPNINVSDDTEETLFYGNYTNKISLDLFILDNESSSILIQKYKVIVMKMIYGMAMAHRFSIDYSKYNMLEKLQVLILSNVGKLFSYKTVYNCYQKIIQMDNVKNTQFCFCGISIPPYFGKVFPKNSFEKAIQVQFEGISFNAPVGYNEVLTIYYGDYMTPPEKKDRIPKHASVED